MTVHRIAGIGELLWDKLPAGARLGGATANFATFCARFGNYVSLVSSIGDDADGRQAHEILARTDLYLDQLQVSSEHPTGTVEVSFSSDDQPVYSISEAVAWDFIEWRPQLLELASRADAVYFGTLSQRSEVSQSTIRSFVQATSEACIRICDVNLRMPFCSPQVLAWSMSHATIVKVSDEELDTVFTLLREVEPSVRFRPASPHEAAQALLEHFPGCRLVALTLGANGCLVATREEVITHPGFRIQPIDPVGAGDAFTAGLVCAYLGGGSLSAIAEAGNLCGSYVASQPGATPDLPPALKERISTLGGM